MALGPRPASPRPPSVAPALHPAPPSPAGELERLRQMNEFKTRFLNMAAHELNTPMTPIRLQVHMLKSGSLGPLSERQSRAVQTLDRNVERLGRLLKEVLDVARLSSSGLRVSPEPVALDDVVREVLDAFGETANQVGVALTWQGQDGLIVQTDRARLLQVLFNLVSNAIKFTPPDGAVAISAAVEGDQVRVQVADNGLGLSPDQMDQLFQPFSQVHDTAKVSVGGTGLGLYISRGIVRQLGGDMGCASPGPGRGSTFHFTLPVPAEAARQAMAVRLSPIVQRLRELI